MKTFIRGRFLPTMAVSVTAIGGVAVSATDASAQRTPAYPYMDYFGGESWSLEGGALRADFSDDKLGSLSLGGGGGGGSSTEPRWSGALYGAIGVSKAIDPTWNWRLSGAWNYFQDDHTHFRLDGSSGGFPQTTTFDANSQFSFQTLDFDLGRRYDTGMPAGGAQFRLFGGLRGLHVGEHQDFHATRTGGNPATDKTGTFDKVGDSHLWGVGPRVGVDGYVPLGHNWGFVGSASAAGIWGVRPTEIRFDSDSVDPPDPPESNHFVLTSRENAWIANYGVQIGVAYMPWANTTFSAGYRWDAWDNLRLGDDGFHRIVDGLYFKVDVRR